MKINSNNSNITLRHLRAIHAIEEHGGFSRAAAALGVVPSALTETVRQVEREIGVPLFDRRMRPPVPTPIGADFLRETEPFLAGLDRALDRLFAEAQMRAGSLSVGAAPSAISGLVAPSLARFHRAHPAIICTLHDDIAERLAAMVVAGELDLAVAGNMRPSEALNQTELQKDRFGLACSVHHPLAGRAGISLADIDPAMLISLSPDTGTQQLLQEAKGLPDALRKGALGAHSTIAQLGMIRAGIGYGLMPRNAVELFDDPLLCFVPVTDLSLWRTLYLLVPVRRPLSHVAQEFIDRFLMVGSSPGEA